MMSGESPTDKDRLAIQGGPPAVPEGPPAWPLRDESVRAALQAAWSDGSWGRYHGPHCERLVSRLSDMHDAEHILLCASGTYAVEAALRGVGVEAGDEVILAGYDFPGNFRAVEAIGARPLLVDIDPRNWSFDPATLEQVTDGKVRAVVASHLHGGLVPMRRLMELAANRGWAVVEDACQSPGAAIEGRAAGTWGDVGVLSFGGSKLLTAGRGGALITSRADVFQRAKIYGHRGNDAFPLSELQAAVLLPQIDLLEERNRRRRESVTQLLSLVEDLAVFRPLSRPINNSEPSFYKLAWRYEATAELPSRETVIAALQAEGVAIDSGFRGFVDRGERRCRKIDELTHSRLAAERTILLHHPVLLADEATIDRVAVAIQKINRAVVHGELGAAGDVS